MRVSLASVAQSCASVVAHSRFATGSNAFHSPDGGAVFTVKLNADDADKIRI